MASNTRTNITVDAELLSQARDLGGGTSPPCWKRACARLWPRFGASGGWPRTERRLPAPTTIWTDTGCGPTGCGSSDVAMHRSRKPGRLARRGAVAAGRASGAVVRPCDPGSGPADSAGGFRSAGCAIASYVDGERRGSCHGDAPHRRHSAGRPWRRDRALLRQRARVDAFPRRQHPRFPGRRLCRLGADGVAEEVAHRPPRRRHRRLGPAWRVEPGPLHPGNRTVAIGDGGEERRPGVARAGWIAVVRKVLAARMEAQRREVTQGRDAAFPEIDLRERAGDRPAHREQRAGGVGPVIGGQAS